MNKENQEKEGIVSQNINPETISITTRQIIEWFKERLLVNSPLNENLIQFEKTIKEANLDININWDNIHNEIIANNLLEFTFDENEKTKKEFSDILFSIRNTNESFYEIYNNNTNWYTLRSENRIYTFLGKNNPCIFKYDIEKIDWPFILWKDNNDTYTIFSTNSWNYIPTSNKNIEIIWKNPNSDEYLAYYYHSNNPWILNVQNDKFHEKFVQNYDTFEYIPEIWFIFKLWLYSFVLDFEWKNIIDEKFWNITFTKWEWFYNSVLSINKKLNVNK